MTSLTFRRLDCRDLHTCQTLFTLMASVFEEESGPLHPEYLVALLSREDVWVVVAFEDDKVVGGLTGYALPMTRRAMVELFIYDVAVRADCQRRGLGRALFVTTESLAAQQDIKGIFVSAENEDIHALDFYRAIGGQHSAVTHFSFSVGEFDK